MYAIFRSGGKQYTVKAGDVVRVEKLRQQLGAEIDLTDVLFVGGDKEYIGTPVVSNAKVKAVVTSQDKAPKVIVFKKKRRQGYRRMRGHRQLFTELFIKEITNPEGQSSKAESKPKVSDPVKKQEVKSSKTAAKGSKKKASSKKAVSKKETVSKKKAKSKE